MRRHEESAIGRSLPVSGSPAGSGARVTYVVFTADLQSTFDTSIELKILPGSTISVDAPLERTGIAFFNHGPDLVDVSSAESEEVTTLDVGPPGYTFTGLGQVTVRIH